MKTASEERVAHTPGPWILLNERSRSIYAQRNGERQHIANTEVLDCAEPTDESAEQACDEEAANAAFIVTACNAHEALVDALRAMEAVLSATFKSQSSIQAMSADEYGEALKAYNQAKSVLKLAGQ